MSSTQFGSSRYFSVSVDLDTITRLTCRSTSQGFQVYIASTINLFNLDFFYFAEAPTENASPAKCLISKLYISPRRPLRMPRLRNARLRNYIFGGGLYMTLGRKFYIFSVFSPWICFCFVKQYCIAGVAAFFEILLLAVSKHVLKRS